jgi:tRNA dimethylallyltransferase
MATKPLVLPLVVIVGPTASGKTSLAIDLAEAYSGEIICADSRTIYRYMDIGTAKPTAEEQARVPHWGIDLVNPGEYFSAADFKQYALGKISEIRARGHIPFLVGGTGLYIDSVVLDYNFSAKSDPLIRAKLEVLSLDELYAYCYKNNIKLPENYKNKRYVIRAIESYGSDINCRLTPIDNTLVVGIATDKDVLKERIAQRFEQMFENSVVNEAKMLGEKYGWSSEAMKSNIYPLLHLYLEGGLTQDDVKNKFVTLDWRLAKRQLTWLRRHKFIQWFELDGVRDYLVAQLAIRE